MSLNTALSTALAEFAAKTSFCAKSEGKYQLPSGACTSVHPSSWAWQCEPGIGNDASCVGIPEPESNYPPSSGIMPAIPAAPPAVVVDALFLEDTDRYAVWSSCHPVAPTLDEWANSPILCGGGALTAAAPAGGQKSAGNAVDGGSIFGAFGCLLVGLAILGAAADVVGKR